MGFFDTDPPTTHSYGEEIMSSHAAAHPGYTGPEAAMSGNRYPLPDADGKIVVWPGATTLAGELDNPYALQNWQLRQVARGMGLRPDLVAQAGACVDDDRETLREVVRAAQGAAAVQSGANLGSALHMAFERVDRGESIDALPEMFHADIKARQEALEWHGITILPEYRERVVRCLIHKCAGRLDGVARLADGSLVVFDDKSEKDPTRYPHSKCVQIGVYANAGELWNYRSNTPEPMPDVRKDFALVLHSRPGEAKCEVYRVDIARGWAAAYISVQLREWRKAEGLIAPYLSEGSWLPKVEPVHHAPVDPEGDPVKEALRLAKLPISVLQQWCRDAGLSVVSLEPATLAESLVLCALNRKPVSERLSVPDDEPDDEEGYEKDGDGGPSGAGAVSNQPEWTPSEPVLANGGYTLVIDPQTEAAELAGLPKPTLQEMCQSVGIDDVSHHRAWLAKEYVAARNKLGKSESEMVTLRRFGGQATVPQPASIAPQQEAAVEEPAELTALETTLSAIEEAPDKKALAAIWDWWTTDHPETGEEAQAVMAAGLSRMKVIENLRPVGADNPFAD